MTMFVVGEDPDRHRMELQEYIQSVNRLLDELKPDQMYTLLRLLRQIEGDKAMASYYIGQIMSIMRLIHKTCAGCGQNHTADEHHLLYRDASDLTKVEDVSELRSLEEILEFLNLVLVDEANADGTVRCRKCSTEFPSIQHRSDQGPECPVCSWGGR